MNQFEDPDVAAPIPPHWPNSEADLLGGGTDWWLVACLDYPRDAWLWYVSGYWKAANVIVAHVVETGRDQDHLIYPFLMCWRHYVEIQLKTLIILLRTYRREPVELPKTHKIDHLWRLARPLLAASRLGDETELANVGRVLTQLQELDPTSEHFRYPVRNDGSETLPTLGKVHMRCFHEAMEGVANFFDGSDTGLREMIDRRNEYDAAVYEE